MAFRRFNGETGTAGASMAALGATAQSPASPSGPLSARSSSLHQDLIRRTLNICLGLLLSLAGAAKAHESVFWPKLEESLWSNRWIETALAAFEVLFGAWLLLGLLPRATWLFSSICFSAYFSIAVFQGLSGHTSCGCWGRLALSLSPWYMVAVDSIIVLSLLALGPPPYRLDQTRRWRYVAFATALVTVVCGAVYAALALGPSPVSDADIESPNVPIALEPKEWIGETLPVLKYVDIQRQLAKGRWVLFFFHDRCSQCKRDIPRYLTLAHELSNDGSAPRLALIEVPQSGGSSNVASAGRSYCSRGKLTEKTRWIMGTPVYVGMSDGRVTGVTHSLETVLSHAGAFTTSKEELSRQIDMAREAATASLFPNYREIRRRWFLQHIACGPLSLIAMCHHLGLELESSEQEALLRAAGDLGIDMLKLQELAETHGLHALGVAASPGKLRELGLPAIVHLEGRGFAALLGYPADGFRVLYPMEERAVVVPQDLFTASFGKTGAALLLSTSPLEPRSLGLQPAQPRTSKQGPCLRLGKRSLGLGRLHVHEWRGSVTIHNDGAHSLEIKNVDCRCFKARVDHATVAPGSFTTLHVEGKTPAGPFACPVLLETNDEPSTLSIPVHGYVEPPAFFAQPAIAIRGLLPGQGTSRDVPVELSSAVSGAQLIADVKGKVPLTASLRRTSDHRNVMRLDFEGFRDPGWYNCEVGVRLKNASASATSFLHVAVEILPTIDLFPRALEIPQHDLRSAWTRTITVTPHRALDRDISCGLFPPYLAKHLQLTSVQGEQGRIRLTISHPANGPDRATFPQTGELIIQAGTEKFSLPIVFGDIP